MSRQKLHDFVDNEPEWAMSALLRFLQRFVAGEQDEASAKKYRNERAAAEAAHLAVTE